MIRCPTLGALPPPPPGRFGWPWTEETPQVDYTPIGEPLPPISIVTPSFNQGAFLEETIRSVLLQGYPNLEYILIDGGSTDKTTEVIRKYEPWISYWVSEKDCGQSDAINKGLEKCSGMAFNWLNADDYYEPGALRTIGHQFSTHSRIEFVSGKERHFEESDRSVKVTRDGTRIYSTIEESLFHHWCAQPSHFWRLSIVQELGGVSNNLRYLMDAELYLRYLLKSGQFRTLKVDSPLVNFRYHEGSKSVSSQVGFGEEARILDFHLARTIEAPTEILSVLSRGIDPHDCRLPDNKWYIGVPINRSRMEGLFCRRIAHESYAGREYSFARQYLSHYFQLGAPYLDLFTLSLSIKLFLVPDPLVDFLRAVRNLPHSWS